MLGFAIQYSRCSLLQGVHTCRYARSPGVQLCALTSGPSYWEERFAVEASYEWLANFNALQPALERLLPPKHRKPKLLLVGCGNSNFSADLFDAGWTDITSTDFSHV